MNDQKLENSLNLALEATKGELEKSAELEAGFDRKSGSWELIVRYNGNLEEALAFLPEVEAQILTGGYAVLRVPEPLVDALASLPQIEYIEKPKLLNFAVNQGRSASCMNPVQAGPDGLTGRGVIVAVIDSGIDFFHEDFRNPDGTTRILELWDQQLEQVFTRQEINEALGQDSREKGEALVPSRDLSGHGTAVAGIAAGNGRESGGTYRGAAYESEILAVRLGVPEERSFPRTTELMRALDYVVNRSLFYQRPAAVNLSFGNTYGSHEPYN